jgi:glyoxylase-like metal-dependent hydrolase (beta-lactamase superfamily II)
MNTPHPLDHRYDSEYVSGCRLEGLAGSMVVAPGVKVIPTAGHTPGGQSVVV